MPHEKSNGISMSFRNTQMTERAVRIKDYFEFHNVMRNTATAGADDVLTEFVGMCKIFFVHRHDIWSR